MGGRSGHAVVSCVFIDGSPVCVRCRAYHISCEYQEQLRQARRLEEQARRRLLEERQEALRDARKREEEELAARRKQELKKAKAGKRRALTPGMSFLVIKDEQS